MNQCLSIRSKISDIWLGNEEIIRAGFRKCVGERGVRMKVSVDADLCIGCGLCIDTAPDVFHWNDDGKPEAQVREVPEDLEEACEEAIENCPTDAISEE